MKKTIVITGASRGIGRAIAIELAGKDTNIVINCVNNVDKLNEVKSIIEEKGSECETFAGNMGNYSDVQKMFDMCLQRFGQVDVLINNAGISVVGLFQDMSEDEWHRICNTNIDSVFNKKVYAEQALAETYHSLPDYLPSISGFSDNYPQLLLYYLHPWPDLRLLLKADIHFLSYLQKWMPEFPAYRHR